MPELTPDAMARLDHAAGHVLRVTDNNAAQGLDVAVHCAAAICHELAALREAITDAAKRPDFHVVETITPAPRPKPAKTK